VSPSSNRGGQSKEKGTEKLLVKRRGARTYPQKKAPRKYESREKKQSAVIGKPTEKMAKRGKVSGESAIPNNPGPQLRQSAVGKGGVKSDCARVVTRIHGKGKKTGGAPAK